MRTRFNRTISLVIAALLLVTTLGSDVLTVNAVEADAVETYSQEESVDSVDVAPVDYVVTDAEGNVVNDDAVVEDETTTENLDEAEATGDADADEEEEIEEDGEVEEDLDEVLDFGKFDVEGATVFITAPRTAFANPDSTTVAVKAITSERQIEKVAEAIESASEEEVGVENVLVFDITFSDENGEVEPFEDVNVRFEDIALESDSYEVYHMEDANAEAELVGEDLGAVVDITSDAVEISTDEFSWYAIKGDKPDSKNKDLLDITVEVGQSVEYARSEDYVDAWAWNDNYSMFDWQNYQWVYGESPKKNTQKTSAGGSLSCDYATVENLGQKDLGLWPGNWIDGNRYYRYYKGFFDDFKYQETFAIRCYFC